jgi:glycosyltransferase involved in cell wall biosynthesis
MKVLILVPPQNKPGGISKYYNSLKEYFSSDIEYFERGNRSEIGGWRGYFDYLNDYWKFFQILNKNKFDRFLLNTSLERLNSYRDLVFIFMILSFKKESVLFFHGWSIQYQNELDQNLKFQKFPFTFLKKASHFIVLANSFKEKLIEWDFKRGISVFSTAVENRYIDSFEFKEDKFRTVDDCFNFLLLSRIENNKGVLNAVKLFASIQKHKPQKKIRLIIAGSGSALDSIKDYVSLNEIQNVEFTGFITGLEKINVFKKCHFFIFPSPQEGFPIALIEAMSFGLPVYCIASGGIRDFFQDGIMGVVQETFELDTAATKIIQIFNNREKLIEIGRFNSVYSKEHFMASDIARKLEGIIKANFDV